jgi:uncharacterized Fe-S cluster-containing radical SAM superfamily enzyme
MAELFMVPTDMPLIGSVNFGLVDRGTNVIQVRPSTACPLSCIFCSTDAGPCSRRRRAEYIVDFDHIMEWFRALSSMKGKGIEAHIDTVGDPLAYPRLVDLVSALSDDPNVDVISLQTHGHLLTERLLDGLSEAGLDRVNLSIDSTDPDQARTLAGTAGYDLGRIKRMAEYLVRETKIDLLLAPVWVHPLNDGEMDGLVALARDLGAGKRWPPVGIQKCEFHRLGRRTKGMRPVSWYRFYRGLREMEARLGTKLVLTPKDFGMKPARSIKAPFARGERIGARVVGPGWFNGESLAVTKDGNWSLTVVGVELPEGTEVKVRLLRTKDGILVGRPS